jgi:hypothetical protein
MLFASIVNVPTSYPTTTLDIIMRMGGFFHSVPTHTRSASSFSLTSLWMDLRFIMSENEVPQLDSASALPDSAASLKAA